MGDFLDRRAWVALLREKPGIDRQRDREIGEMLGWRVSKDPWWNWHPGPRFDPPGDEWCIRKDGRNDTPCNEPLPYFTAEMLDRILSETADDH